LDHCLDAILISIPTAPFRALDTSSQPIGQPIRRFGSKAGFEQAAPELRAALDEGAA
jgi:hypothetical protein